MSDAKHTVLAGVIRDLQLAGNILEQSSAVLSHYHLTLLPYWDFFERHLCCRDVPLPATHTQPVLHTRMELSTI